MCIIFIPIQLIFFIFVWFGDIAYDLNNDIIIFADGLANKLNFPRKNDI